MIGKIIHELRKAKGYPNSKAFAKASGVPVSTINKLECGLCDNPRVKTLDPLCQLLGVTLDAVISEAKKRAQVQ